MILQFKKLSVTSLASLLLPPVRDNRLDMQLAVGDGINSSPISGAEGSVIFSTKWPNMMHMQETLTGSTFDHLFSFVCYL